MTVQNQSDGLSADVLERYPRWVRDALVELKDTSTEELIEGLERARLATIENIRQWGIRLLALKLRGEDVSQYRRSIMGIFLAVAEGRADPGLVFQLQLKPRILQQAIRMPLDEQQEMASNQTAYVVVEGSAGSKVPLQLLSPEQCRQVFADDHVRSFEEQVVWRRQRDDQPKERISKLGGIRLLRGRKAIVVDVPRTLNISDLKTLLTELEDG